MMSRRALAVGCIICACLAGPPTLAQADSSAPEAASLLFEEPQLANVPVGGVLTYAYHRKTSDQALYGPSIEDRISLAIRAGKTDATRTVDVALFSGANRRAAGPFEDMSGNPILSLFLEHHVDVLARMLQANPRYLKNTIRAALRDKAVVAKIDKTIAGKAVSGWSVEITPFKDDPNKARMKGLDVMRYRFLVAKELPGEVVEISVTASTAAAVLLDEEVSYEAKPD